MCENVLSGFFMTYVLGRELVRLGVDPSSRLISWRSNFTTEMFWAFLERRNSYSGRGSACAPTLRSVFDRMHCHNVLVRFDDSYVRLKELVVRWLDAGVDSVAVVRLVSLVSIFSGRGTLAALEKLAPGELPVGGDSSNLVADEKACGRVCLC